MKYIVGSNTFNVLSIFSTSQKADVIFFPLFHNLFQSDVQFSARTKTIQFCSDKHWPQLQLQPHNLRAWAKVYCCGKITSTTEELWPRQGLCPSFQKHNLKYTTELSKELKYTWPQVQGTVISVYYVHSEKYTKEQERFVNAIELAFLLYSLFSHATWFITQPFC